MDSTIFSNAASMVGSMDRREQRSWGGEQVVDEGDESGEGGGDEVQEQPPPPPGVTPAPVAPKSPGVWLQQPGEGQGDPLERPGLGRGVWGRHPTFFSAEQGPPHLEVGPAPAPPDPHPEERGRERGVE